MTNQSADINGGLYSAHPRYPVSVDCIIFSLHGGGLSVLLAPRSFPPHAGTPSLMGGFVTPHETLDEAASRVLSTLTGLDAVYMEQVGAFGAPDRDPADRVVSIAYYALINSDADMESRLHQYGAAWVRVDSLPKLRFDHPLMISRALSALRSKIAAEPVMFNLLPDSFTVAQAQQVCELIAGEPQDKRNFRRRLLDNPCIEPTGKIDKLTSRRGATMYRFNQKLYSSNPIFKL